MAKYDLRTTLGQMRDFAAAVVDEVALGRERYETDRYGRAWIDYHLLLLGEATNRVRAELDVLLDLAGKGCAELTRLQEQSLSS